MSALPPCYWLKIKGNGPKLQVLDNIFIGNDMLTTSTQNQELVRPLVVNETVRNRLLMLIWPVITIYSLARCLPFLTHKFIYLLDLQTVLITSTVCWPTTNSSSRPSFNFKHKVLGLNLTVSRSE